MMRATIRVPAALIALTAAAALAACGDDGAPSAPPGSPENPLSAAPAEPGSGGRSNESAAAAKGEQPSFEDLVARQSDKPAVRFTPCNLVTAPQARAIVGAPIEQPFEAPQGPTCIYRSRDGESFVTLAVQALDLDDVKSMLQQRRRVEVSDRSGYCGHSGQDMLYVPLGRRGVLSVAAPCPLAKQFAAHAVRRFGD